MSTRRVHRKNTRSLAVASSCKESGAEVEKLRQSEVVYRSKIRSLEEEVDTLKYRLDSLRRAKSTTIIRREREEIRITSPKLGRHYSSGHTRSLTPLPHPPSSPPPFSHHSSTPPHSYQDELIQQLKAQVDGLNAELLSGRTHHERVCEELKHSHKQEVADLRGQHKQQVKTLTHEMDLLKQHQAQDVLKCQTLDNLLFDFETLKAENSDLAEKLQQLISANKALRDSNELLQGKCETLLEDLSVKEAKWTEREEMLTAEIRKKWGERYHEWISKAEKKMEELQQINTMLQGLLKIKQHNPDL